MNDYIEQAADNYVKSTLVGSPYIKKCAFKAGIEWFVTNIWNDAHTSVPENNNEQIISIDSTGYMYIGNNVHPNAEKWLFAKNLINL